MGEENEFLKRRIKNVEKNVKLMMSRSIDNLFVSNEMFPENVSFVSNKDATPESSFRHKDNIEPILSKKSVPLLYQDDEFNLMNSYERKRFDKYKNTPLMPLKKSSTIKTTLKLKESAILRSVFPYYL